MGNVGGGSVTGRRPHGHRVAGEGSPATIPEAPGPAGGDSSPGGTVPVYDVGGMVPGVVPLAEIQEFLARLEDYIIRRPYPFGGYRAER